MREGETVRRRDCDRKKRFLQGHTAGVFAGQTGGEIVRSENYVEKFIRLEYGKPTKIRFCKKGIAMAAATW